MPNRLVDATRRYRWLRDLGGPVVGSARLPLRAPCCRGPRDAYRSV